MDHQPKGQVILMSNAAASGGESREYETDENRLADRFIC